MINKRFLLVTPKGKIIIYPDVEDEKLYTGSFVVNNLMIESIVKKCDSWFDIKPMIKEHLENYDYLPRENKIVDTIYQECLEKFYQKTLY